MISLIFLLPFFFFFLQGELIHHIGITPGFSSAALCIHLRVPFCSAGDDNGEDSLSFVVSPAFPRPGWEASGLPTPTQNTYLSHCCLATVHVPA